MGNRPTYKNVLKNVSSANIFQNGQKILGFERNFCALLATTEKEVDTSVKVTHSANSARADAAQIMIL